MGFGLKGDSLPPTTGFPIVIWFCNISHATVPLLQTIFLVFNSFKGPAIESHNGLGSRLANQIAREHFGNKIDFQTISPLSDRGIYIRKSFPKVSAFQPLKSISNSLRSHYEHFCQEA